MSDVALFDTPDPAVRRYTERDVLDLLARRYGMVAGNGPRYVYAEHVRNAAGHAAQRTADFIAMDTWPSRGLALHGHEVKVSRSDWLHELKQPEKAEPFKRHMDYWWLVAAPGVARPDELPDGWGLLVAAGNGLRTVTEAPRLTPPPRRALTSSTADVAAGVLDVSYTSAPDLPRSMMAAFLRAAVQTAKNRGGE